MWTYLFFTDIFYGSNWNRPSWNPTILIYKQVYGYALLWLKNQPMSRPSSVKQCNEMEWTLNFFTEEKANIVFRLI